MLHRPRSDVPSSADRVAGLLTPVRGGWLPPADDEPVPVLERVPELEPDLEPGPEPQPVAEPEAAAMPHPVDGAPEPDALERSWSPPGRRRATAPAPSRWRLDVGRGAVAALLVVAALAAVVAAGVVLRGRPQEVAAPVVEVAGAPLPGAPLPGAGSPSAAPTGEVVVAVAGEVRSPGLVRLPAGSRVDDAVRAAGGPLEPTSTGLLNLARVLVDGEQVLVGVEPPPGAAPVGPSGTGPPGPLDLNTASASDLDALPGIGPVLAQRIIDWRTANGRFASVDQLREVTGIGEAKYQDLRDAVGV